MNVTKAIKILIILAVNAGGEGKSTLAELLYAICRLCGISVQVLDADEGNAAFTAATNIGDRLHWGSPRDTGAQFVTFYDDVQVHIVDGGANALTDSSGLVGNFSMMCERASQLGRDPHVFVPISTNKAGSAQGADAAFQLLSKYAKTHLIQNNRDGSNNFDETETKATLKLGHVAPGIQAVRSKRLGASLDQIILEPEPEFRLASGILAAWLQRFAIQEPIASMLGLDAKGIPLLNSFESPKPTQFVVRHLKDAQDENLLLNRACYSAEQEFLMTDVNDMQFLERSIKLHDLTLRYRDR